MTYKYSPAKPPALSAGESGQSAACVQTPVVAWQTAVRKSVTRNIALEPGREVVRPQFAFRGADGFRIVKVGSHADILPFGETLQVEIAYTLHYSDGFNQLSQPDRAVFTFKADHPTTAGFRRFETGSAGGPQARERPSSFYRIDALAQAFGEMLCPCTGALIVDIGAFFVIRYETVTQLLLPAVAGYAPQEGGRRRDLTEYICRKATGGDSAKSEEDAQ